MKRLIHMAIVVGLIWLGITSFIGHVELWNRFLLSTGIRPVLVKVVIDE